MRRPLLGLLLMLSLWLADCIEIWTSQQLADAMAEFGRTGANVDAVVMANITVDDTVVFRTPRPGDFSAGELRIAAGQGKLCWGFVRPLKAPLRHPPHTRTPCAAPLMGWVKAAGFLPHNMHHEPPFPSPPPLPPHACAQTLPAPDILLMQAFLWTVACAQTWCPRYCTFGNERCQSVPTTAQFACQHQQDRCTLTCQTGLAGTQEAV